jgi:flagellar hook-length control protein FliK
MVQLVAAAAASAIVTNTAAAAQATDGRARQTGTAAEQGGGWFADLLAELLQGAQSSQDASQIPADPSQQTGAEAPAATGPDTSKKVLSADADQQSSANGQTGATGNQNNWLAAWLAALAQTQQAAGQTNPTGTSPQDALAALLQNQNSQDSTPADAKNTDGTQVSGDPSQDASLLATLQSLAAQFAQAQTGTTAQSQTSQSASDAVGATSGTPSDGQLAALLQTLQTEAAAMNGAAPTATADAQPATPTQTNDTPATGATQAPAQHTPVSQANQQALHPFTAPVTQAPSAHSGFGSNTGSQSQSGQHGSTANAQTDGQTGAQTASNGSSDTASGNASLPTFLQVAHDQTIVQQNTANAAAQNNAVNAVAATTPAQASTQPVAATLQVGPATQAENPTPNVHALAVSIATQSQAGAKQFDIRLDPPELGRVDVRLTVDNAGKAQAHLAVDKPQTLELLQKDSGNLARALKDSGVQLSNNGLQFSLKGQSRNGDGSRGSQSRGRSLSVTAVASTAPVGAASSSTSVSASGVDIRV